MVSQQLRLKQRPEGLFKQDDFELVEETLPDELAEGQVRLRTLYLSLDPTQRMWAQVDTYLPKVPIGEVMRSLGLAVVTETNNARFAEGDIVTGMTGWQSQFISDGKGFQIIPYTHGIPLETYLGPLGMTGITAYFGLFDIGKPKEGETLLVSGAAGAVGSIVCQLGKLKGLRVVGTAGSDEKCRWLEEELGVDVAINYKTEKLYKALRKACPEGVDVYFENVGGEILDAVLGQINVGARIALCGYISAYASSEQAVGIHNLANLISKRAKIEGFLVLDYMKRASEAVLMLANLVNEGKLHYRMDVQEGFEQIPTHINRLFTGENTGKLVVKLSEHGYRPDRLLRELED